MPQSNKAKIKAAAKTAAAKPAKPATKAEMVIEHRHVTTLQPYERNARTHSPAQVQAIADSIKRFGFNNPILIDDKNGVIAGHGRLEAAKLLGMKSVPTIVLTHLTDAERRAYVLADNRLFELGSWSFDTLKVELESLMDEGFELPVMGFDEDFMQNMLQVPAAKGLGPTVVSQSTSYEGPAADDGEEEEDDDGYTPELNPTKGVGEVSERDVDKAAANLAAKPVDASKQNLVELICPHCGESYEVDRASIA